METFKEITATIGIDDSPYMLKKMYVNQKLLGNRNKIVHGERLENLNGISCAKDYIELHKEIVGLIDTFAQNIKAAAINKEYRI